MNERIKTLLAHAHADAEDIRDTNWIAERFANLIIQDCIIQCQEVADDADRTANGSFVTDAGKLLHQGMWGGANSCISAICHHFDV